MLWGWGVDVICMEDRPPWCACCCHILPVQAVFALFGDGQASRDGSTLHTVLQWAVRPLGGSSDLDTAALPSSQLVFVIAPKGNDFTMDPSWIFSKYWVAQGLCSVMLPSTAFYHLKHIARDRGDPMMLTHAWRCSGLDNCNGLFSRLSKQSLWQQQLIQNVRGKAGNMTASP